MRKIVFLFCVSLFILSACSSKQVTPENASVVSPTPNATTTIKVEEVKTNLEKVNRDFVFSLINSRQQFKDIGTIGTNAYKDFIEKKSNKDEFAQKIEDMRSQLTIAYKSLEVIKTTDDPNITSLYSDLKGFVSTYYLDIYYPALLAQSKGDDKSFKNYMDKSKSLESKNREIDKQLNDLKMQYKL